MVDLFLADEDDPSREIVLAEIDTLTADDATAATQFVLFIFVFLSRQDSSNERALIYPLAHRLNLDLRPFISAISFGNQPGDFTSQSDLYAKTFRFMLENYSESRDVDGQAYWEKAMTHICEVASEFENSTVLTAMEMELDKVKFDLPLFTTLRESTTSSLKKQVDNKLSQNLSRDKRKYHGFRLQHIR